MATSHPELPGYRFVDLVGRGAFGVVYRAVQVAVDREVAVKVDSRMVLDERDRRRFLRETRAAGLLSGHPHVVDLYDAGTLADHRPYLVMELCTGGSLLDLLRERGPVPPHEAFALGAKIADALAAAHADGVLHRDIKPANILLNRFGVPGLADFGLAVLASPGPHTSATLTALTPAYAAPEAFRSQNPTERADIYSLGATIYALISGRPPRFPAVGEPSLTQIVRLHDEPVPPIAGVPDELMAVLIRALATDPGRRHLTAGELRDALSPHATAPAPAPSESVHDDEVPAVTVSVGFGPRRDEETTLGRVADADQPHGPEAVTEDLPGGTGSPVRQRRTRVRGTLLVASTTITAVALAAVGIALAAGEDSVSTNPDAGAATTSATSATGGPATGSTAVSVSPAEASATPPTNNGTARPTATAPRPVPAPPTGPGQQPGPVQRPPRTPPKPRPKPTRPTTAPQPQVTVCGPSNCAVQVTFTAGGERLTTCDNSADGHSAVTWYRRTDVPGEKQAWVTRGKGVCRTRDLNMPEGAAITFKACTGEYSKRELLKCGRTVTVEAG